MSELYGLSASDVGVIRDLVQWWKQQKSQVVRRKEPDPVVPEAGAYLAFTPTGGIPAMLAEAGTGTHSSRGVISKADCPIFRIDDREPSMDVDPMGFTQTVYNPSTTAIPGNTMIEIIRHKLGHWMAVQGGGSSSAGTLFIFFTLPSALATTDASKASCTVDSYFGGSNPGGSVTVYNVAASTNYIFSGASGHKGIAVYDTTNSKFWIIQLECP